MVHYPNSDPGTYNFTKGNISTVFDAQPVPSVVTLGWASNIEMVGIGALSRNGRNIFSIATLGTGKSLGIQGIFTKHEMLSNVQCEATFTRMTFRTRFDVKDRLINVTDIGEAEKSAFNPPS